jgi:hypothetical protein
MPQVAKYAAPHTAEEGVQLQAPDMLDPYQWTWGVSMFSVSSALRLNSWHWL